MLNMKHSGRGVIPGNFESLLMLLKLLTHQKLTA